jgi:hypothetical protein
LRPTPLVSRTEADSAVVSPVWMVELAGLTATLPTGMGTTLMLALPLLPSLVAVTVAAPGATAVTLPLGETIATAVLLEDQLTVRSVTMTSFASRTTAVSDSTCVGTSVTDAGDTATLPTGTATTVTEALPLLPPLVAETVAVPTARPVTTPVADTVATATLLDVQAMSRSLTMAPVTSFTVGVKVVVAPTRMVAVSGCSVTLAMAGGTTVTALVPLFPSLAAVMVAEPGAKPVTTPAADTVATAELSDDQVTARSSGAPLTSLISAPSVMVPPTTSVALDGCTATLATGTGDTVTVALPLAPSLVAVMVAAPTP